MLQSPTYQPDFIDEINWENLGKIFIQEVRNLSIWLNQEEISQIEQAYKIWFQAHHWEKRKDGEDYVMHTIRTALNVAIHSRDPQSIILALLHDVIENSHYWYQYIVDQFWEDVGNMVRNLSKKPLENYIGNITVGADWSNEEKQILATIQHEGLWNYKIKELPDRIQWALEKIRTDEYLWSLKNLSPIEIIVKIFDRIDNLSKYQALSRKKKKSLVKSTIEYFLPIAKSIDPVLHQILIEKINTLLADHPELKLSLVWVDGVYNETRKKVVEIISEQVIILERFTWSANEVIRAT